MIALLPYILLAIAAFGGMVWADEGWHNAVARRAEAKLAAVQQRADAQAIAAQRAVSDAEIAAKMRAEHDDTEIAALRDRVGHLPAMANCALSVGTIGVLDAASSFANSGDAGVDHAPGVTVPLVPSKPLL